MNDKQRKAMFSKMKGVRTPYKKALKIERQASGENDKSKEYLKKSKYDSDDDETNHHKLEKIEDKYGVDLTHLYGEDFENKKTQEELKKILGKNDAEKEIKHILGE